MHGPSHFVLSWFIADATGLDQPRNRRIVAIAGFAPDLDVLAYIAGILYFVATSRKLLQPLGAIVQAASSSGKSSCRGSRAPGASRKGQTIEDDGAEGSAGWIP